MTNFERRKEILKRLEESGEYITAAKFSEIFGVTRQIIVSDIAILRANGYSISATKNGYFLEKDFPDGIIESIVCRHSSQRVTEEFYTIVDNGGEVINVIVEHPIYGQISADLNICSRYDADEFVRMVEESGASQLCDLTDGIHIHTIFVPDKSSYDRIVEKLSEIGILVS